MSYTASDLKLVKDHQNTTQSFTVNELYSKWSQTSKRPPEHYTEFDSYTVNDELYSKWSQTSKRPPKHYTEFYS